MFSKGKVNKTSAARVVPLSSSRLIQPSSSRLRPGKLRPGRLRPGKLRPGRLRKECVTAIALCPKLKKPSTHRRQVGRAKSRCYDKKGIYACLNYSSDGEFSTQF